MVKKENLPLKTGKKLPEKLLCVRLIQLTVTAFSSKSLSLTLFLCNLQSDIWKPIEGYGENEISFLKTAKKLSEKLLCVLLIRLTELHLSLQEAFR